MIGMTKAEICAFRRVLDKITEKFGKYAYLELCDDGSGFVGDKLRDGCKVVEFDGLGELSTILETSLVDMALYYTSKPGGGHGKW